MEKKKILACSDYLDLGSSYAKQSRLIMEMVDAEWHYMALGYNGPVLGVARNGKTPAYTVYPNVDEPLESNYASKLNDLAAEVKPDALLIYDDIQNVVHYKLAGLDCPVIGYVPYDADYHIGYMNILPRAVDIIVVLSDFAKKLFNDRGIDVDVIYNCVDEEAFGPCKEGEAATVKKRLGIAPERKMLLYVGALHRRKNPEVLIAMARELKRLRGSDFTLVIHGNTDFKFMNCDLQMERLMHGVKDVVMFTDDLNPKPQWPAGIPARNLNVMYNAADVFVSAHGGEGFGIPACEAGLCNVPFVMTDCTTTPEFSDGGRNGVAIPAPNHRTVDEMSGTMIRPIPDHVKMAEEVNALLNDEKRRKAMGKSFHEHVLAKYSRHALAPKWKALFERCFVEKVKVKEI